MKLLVKLLVGAIVATGSMSAQAIAYKVTSLGGNYSFGTSLDINNVGQVAGTVYTESDSGQAAVWSKGAWTVLNPGVQSTATAINDHGHVVGSTIFDGSRSVATLWRDGSAQLLTNANLWSQAGDINNAGQIVGTASIPMQERGNSPALWSNGAIQYLSTRGGYATAINERGQIVGSIENGGDPFVRATIWNNGKPTQLDPIFSDANAINESGTVVGNLRGSDVRGATSWGPDADAFVDQPYSAFSDINDAGVAVGYATFGPSHSQSQRAIVWWEGQALDLNELIVEGAEGLGLLQFAHAINDHGQIVGLADNLNGPGSQVFLLTPVPEPEHWAMLLVGLGLVGFTARRKA